MNDTILGAPREWLESDPTRWYVIFCDAQRRCWWDVLFRTRPGFSHVYALRWDGFNWLLFNPAVAYTEVAIMPSTSQNALQSMVDVDATIVEVEAFRKTDRIRGRWWTGPMTCVEQLKALLGLPVGRIWTPWQLYRYLMKEGGDGQIPIWQAKTVNSGRPANCGAPAFRARQVDQAGKHTPKVG